MARHQQLLGACRLPVWCFSTRFGASTAPWIAIIVLLAFTWILFFLVFVPRRSWRERKATTATSVPDTDRLIITNNFLHLREWPL